MTPPLQFDFKKHDYIVDAATGTIQPLPKEHRTGKAKRALEQLTTIYQSAKSHAFSLRLSVAKIVHLQQFASALSQYISEKDHYGVIKWLPTKAQSRLGYGLACDLGTIAKSLDELVPLARLDDERLELQHQRIDAIWSRIDKAAPDYEHLCELDKALHEATEQKEQPWFQERARFVAEATKPALLSTLRLVLREESFSYSLHKKAQELLPLCSLQEVLMLLKEPPLANHQGECLLILRDIFSKTAKKDHDEKAYKEALEYFSDTLWFNLNLCQDQAVLQSLRNLLATLIFCERSLDWAHDFLVRNRRSNDKAIQHLVESLKEIDRESIFPQELKPAVTDLINAYNKYDLVRIRTQAINKELFEIEKIEAFAKALSTPDIPRKTLDEALTFLTEFSICHLNRQAKSPELKKHLRTCLSLLANHSTTIDWLKKFVEKLEEPAWIAPIVDILKTWSQKGSLYPQAVEQIKMLQLLEKALPALKVIEAQETESIPAASLLQIFDAVQTVAPEIRTIRTKCKRVLQKAKEAAVACIKTKELQLLPQLFERLFSLNFIDDFLIQFKKSDPDEASIICLQSTLKAILPTTKKKNEMTKLLLQLSLWRSSSNLIQHLERLCESEEPIGFEAALLQFPEFLRDLPIFQKAVTKFAEGLIRHQITKPDTYLHLLALANPLTELAKFTYLHEMPVEKLALMFPIFEQLLKVQSQLHISYVEMVQLALFLACNFPGAPQEAIHLKRHSFAIARSLIIDKVSKQLYILVKSKNPDLREGGTFKKVTIALLLPSQTSEPPLTVAQAVLKSALDEDTLEEFLHEESLLKELSGSPGIWPLLFSCRYMRCKNGKTEQQGSFFLPLADGHLLKVQFSSQEQLQGALLLAQGLQAMHDKSIIHGDLKEANALYRKKPNAPLETGWIDVGAARQVDSNHKAHFRSGYYGSVYYTPPELFGEKNFTGDPFKLEVWALGYVLYKLHFHRRPQWTSILGEYHDNQNHHPVTLRAKRRLKFSIDTTIETSLKLLLEEQKNRPLTPDEHYQLLIYQMLRYDPALRIELPKAIECLQELNGISFTKA